MTADGASARFTTLSSRPLHDGRARVRLDTVRLPDGTVVEREIVGHDGAVAVVAVTDEGDVLLVRQHRQAVGGEVTELPAGTLDVAGEDVLAAAARELAEETGLAAARLEVLTAFWTSVGWTDERVHVVLARGLRPASADGFVAEHEEAHLTVERLPFDEAVARALDGRLGDAKTVIGLLVARERLARGG